MSTDSQKDLFCELCSLQFHSKTVFNFHKSLVHPNKCDICDKNLSSKEKLARHIYSVHEGKGLENCEICEKNFGDKSTLKAHISSVHEGKKPFKCSYSDANFTLKTRLMNTLYQSMKDKNHTNATFATLGAQQKVT